MSTATVSTREGRRTPALTRGQRRALADISAALLTAGLVFALAERRGGYYPNSWARPALVALCLTTASLALTRRIPLARPERWMLAGLVGWLCWTLALAMRPGAATAGVPEVERGFLYLTVLWAAIVTLRRSTAAAALVGTLAGIGALAIHELAQYLLAPPAVDTYEGRLLFEPIGYANATGVLAAIGATIATGLALHTSTANRRAAAAAALVPLLSVLYLSASRGAAAALAVGVTLLVVTGEGGLPAARRIVALFAVPAVAVWVCSLGAFGDAQHDPVPSHGRIVAVALVTLTIISFLVARAVRPTAYARRRGSSSAGVLASLALGMTALVAVAARSGDRVEYWRVALTDIAHHPLLGSGPGSFADVWLRYRSTDHATRNAHNLYLEKLAEVGPVGLALLLACLLVPLALRRRRPMEPVASIAVAAYAVFLLHAAVDWDWEMPAVTATALVLAAIALVARRPAQYDSGRSVPWQAALLAAATAAAVIPTLIAQRGNDSLAAAAQAARGRSWTAALAYSTDAARLQPWSAEPYLVMGEAQAGLGRRDAARRSFLAAASRDPQDWRAWFDLATLRNDSGPLTRAAVK